MNDRFFPPARPVPVADGLKARSTRGAIAQTWWGERFISVLEATAIGGRLQRGKAYARKGQVISLDVDAGLVNAVVQGSRAKPYRVRIGAAAFGKAEWADVERELAGSAWYLARLLSGEMPAEIEDVFSRLGLNLFPTGARDLSMDCTCPDWGVPCKHLAATFYLLAESFDEDPFRILAWRGRSREDLLANLTAASGGAVAADVAESPDVPLADLLDSFFALQGELPGPSPTASASLLAQAPEVGVLVRGKTLDALLAPAYRDLAD
ncbi:SWIM zinc finger family protein [Occultella kanbiaonis]|uniref:SWIM zinc finger family protein n=1 Tax=Occultella kanbiaonis TaxID=2675754 RepID=UPI0013D5E49D|nr:SWIM zinc finger family protein [Occultella kanbiaonis]